MEYEGVTTNLAVGGDKEMSSFNCEHCNTAITVHADELTREQIEGLKADLGYVDIYNDKTCHFSIIKYA